MGLFRTKIAGENATVSFAGREQIPANATTQTAVDAVIRSYAQQFDASGAPVAITDRSGTIRYVNPPFTALTGYTAAEVLGKTPRILKSGKHDGLFFENMWRHLLAGNVWHGEIVNRKKDGSLYVDEQTITPIKQNDGEIGCFISVRHDATAKKRMELERTFRMEESMLPQRIDQIGERAQTSAELLAQAVELFLTLHEFQTRATGVAFEVSHDQRMLKLVVANGNFSPQFLEEEATVPLGECLCGKAAVEGRVLVCRNCYEDARHEHKWLGMMAHGHYTIPVRTQDRVLAVINLYTDTDVDSSERRVTFFATAGFRLGAYMERLNKAQHNVDRLQEEGIHRKAPGPADA
jgi:PAS domain S-box-containing protein